MSDRETTNAVLAQVRAERDEQDARWGVQNHPDGTGGSESRVYARSARVNCKLRFGVGLGTWCDILSEEVAEAIAESDPARLRAELVQVAAVAVAWIEAIDSRTAP